MQSLDTLVAGMSMFGPGAIGASVAGAVAGALGARGGQIAAAVAAGMLAGAGLGLALIDPAAVPSLHSLFPQFGAAADDAAMTRVLKAYYPDDWARAQQVLAARDAGQMSDADAAQALRAIGLPLMQRQLPLASIQNVAAYLALTRDEQKVLADNPALCLRVMTEPGADTTADMVAALPEDLKVRETGLAIKVLEQTATQPQAPHPTADTEQELTLWTRDAVNGLSFDERDALHGAGGADAKGKAYCKAMGNLLFTLTFDHPPDATEVYKALLAKGASPIGA